MKKLKEDAIDLLQIFLMFAAAWDIFKNRELLALCCMVLVLVVEFTMRDKKEDNKEIKVTVSGVTLNDDIINGIGERILKQTKETIR